MNKAYYQKYLQYNGVVTDIKGNKIHIGDEVVFNNHYNATILTGVVTHFVTNGRVAIKQAYIDYKGDTSFYMNYRSATDILVINHGNNTQSTNKEQSNTEAV